MTTGSLYFFPFSALNKGIQIHCVRQKRFIKRDIELLVAIHDVQNVRVLVALVRYDFDLKLDVAEFDRNGNFIT